MKIKPYLYAAIALLMFASIINSWRQPLLSSHSFRQTETGQMIQVFLEEGWHPLHTKFRYVGRPGYAILEFPLYQSLVAGLSALLRCSIEQSGRLINCLAALLFACGIGRGVREILATVSSEVSESSSDATTTAALVLGSPLVFAMSQWITIELLTGACAAWAFVQFQRMISSDQDPSVRSYVALFLLTLGSVVVKPNVIFVVLPLFAGALWQNYSRSASGLRWSRRRWVLLGASISLALAIGGAWFIYAVWEDRRLGSIYDPLKGSGTLLLGQHSFFSVEVLKRFGQRYFLYVLGPGTVLFFLWASISSGGSAIEARYRRLRPWVIACMGSIFIYLFLFCGANYIHNYYQLPTVLPVYLALGLLIPVVWRPLTVLFFLAAVAMNLTVSGLQLTRQDKDWSAAIPYLQKETGIGTRPQDLLIISNWGAASPVLSFYLDRYCVYRPLDAFTLKEWSQAPNWVVVCDNAINTDCLSQLRLKGFTGGTHQSFGRLDVYLPPSH